MRYTRAENWPGYKMIALKPRVETSFEDKPPSPSLPSSYRALGTRSPVCENHQQAEQEYSTVKAIVKAESQRKLDQALKLAQLAQPPRSVCLSNMYVRPGSAASQDYAAMSPHSAMMPGDSNSSHIQARQNRVSASEYGKEGRSRERRPISAYEFLSEKNHPVSLQNSKSPFGTWESSEYADRLHKQNNTFFYFRDNIKDAHAPSKPSSKSGHLNSFESSKRQRLIFSYLRREMMMERSIVVPLGSIPVTLQVKGNNSRLYNYPKHGQSSWNKDHFAETPLHSVRFDGHKENTPSKAATALHTRSSALHTPAQNVTSRAKSPRPAFRDLGVVSEYKLKMASLATESNKLVALPQRPATAAPSISSREKNIAQTETMSSDKMPLDLDRDTRLDGLRHVRPKSSRGNDNTVGIKVSETVNAKPENEERNLTGKTNASTSFASSKSSIDANNIKNWAMLPAGKSPSFIKGVKYGEQVKKIQGTPAKQAKDLPESSSEGVEGKTELLSQTPRRLSLSVFLPRETNDDSMCHRADTFSSGPNKDMKAAVTGCAITGRKTHKSHHRDGGNSSLYRGQLGSSPGQFVLPSARDNGYRRYSDNSYGFRQSTECAILPESQQKRLKVLHCELFGPDLCQDCQVHVERADVDTWQRAVHPDVGTDMKSFHGIPVQRSCPSPASVSDEDDMTTSRGDN
ncbi:hypothetical protein ElyMa_006078200 [Elysia marginata]|uniref:Uncharacterized protein n=1 Tax=Elysia marginata TaxID=1093978 RepID=A0AAV4GQ35_9GAST|nr:hypothetical protein ElyMa_006078200 [Elysia marginata]